MCDVEKLKALIGDVGRWWIWTLVADYRKYQATEVWCTHAHVDKDAQKREFEKKEKKNVVLLSKQNILIPYNFISLCSRAWD